MISHLEPGNLEWKPSGLSPTKLVKSDGILDELFQKITKDDVMKNALYISISGASRIFLIQSQKKTSLSLPQLLISHTNLNVFAILKPVFYSAEIMRTSDVQQI